MRFEEVKIRLSLNTLCGDTRKKTHKYVIQLLQTRRAATF